MNNSTPRLTPMNLDIEAKTVANAPEWTAAFSRSACLEGWDLYATAGSANGDWQIQCVDDPKQASAELGEVVPALGSDEMAWRLVYEGTESHHIAALEFLEIHNPKEWGAIRKVGDALYPRDSSPISTADA